MAIYKLPRVVAPDRTFSGYLPLIGEVAPCDVNRTPVERTMCNQESTPSRGRRTRSYWNATTIAVWIFVVVEAIAIAWMLANR